MDSSVLQHFSTNAVTNGDSFAIDAKRSTFLKFNGRGNRGVMKSNPEITLSFKVPVNTGGVEDRVIVSPLRDVAKSKKSLINTDRSWRRGNE